MRAGRRSFIKGLAGVLVTLRFGIGIDPVRQVKPKPKTRIITIRTSLPSSQWRSLNEGVSPHRSSTRQIVVEESDGE